MKISFFVPGIPAPQARPRAFARIIGGRATARMYDAGNSKGWKAMVCLYAKRQERLLVLWQECRVRLIFSMPRPRHHFLKAGLRENAPTRHTQKPDLDNLAKAVLDALTDSCMFWSDDGSVYDLSTEKQYAQDPGVHIIISDPQQ